MIVVFKSGRSPLDAGPIARRQGRLTVR
jgi:hypothetical protein